MTERIPMRYTVALEGFGEADRAALDRFFQMSPDRAPAYGPADGFAEADFIIADADQPATVAALTNAGRLRDAVFVGASKPPNAVACLARPISPTHLLTELDHLLEQRLAAYDEPVVPEWLMAAPPEPVTVSPGMSPPESATGLDVLVVDDSRIALKFLQVRLQGLGYRVHLAQNSDAALKLLAAQPFSLVFLDVALGPDSPLDGLGLCQHIKQRKSHPGGISPQVLMVTGLSTWSDRVRGDLAGCDAYLTKPLMEPAFLEALHLVDPTLAA